VKIVQISPFFLPRERLEGEDKKKFEFFGGAETLVYNFSKSLIKKGHEVIIYTINYEENKFDKANFEGIEVRYFPKIKLWKAALSLQLLSNIIRDRKSVFHGVHVGHPLTLFSALICRLFGKPFYCTHVGTRKFFPFAILTSKISSKIIIPTPFSDEFFKSFGSGGNTLVIPHGIDLERYNPSQGDKVLRGNLTREEDFIILFVGRLRWHKGIDYLIRSFNILKEFQDNVHLCIVGDGEERERLEDLVEKRGFNDYIHFLGYVPSSSLPSIYAESDLFILPSITSDDRGHSYPETEAFGIVLLEAMASGVPVIASEVGGVPYVVDDGITGYLVEEKDYVDLARRILFLIRNTEVKEHMSRNAIRKMNRIYDWDKISEKYLKLFSPE
jgi:glycosyltransferase involved in cell wall biosynthesis